MEWETKVAELDARQKTSEHRIRDLEADMRDLRELTQAVALTGNHVEQLRGRVEELHGDVRRLMLAPGRRWNTAIDWIIKGVVGALVAAALAVVIQ